MGKVVAFFVLLGLLSTFAAAQEIENLSVSEDAHVVIISIDGFPAHALWDNQIPLPFIRSLARDGVWAEGLIPSVPSVTWSNHTTLVTGVPPAMHSLVYNGWLEWEDCTLPVRINPRRDKDELVRVPTLYDIAHKLGLTTAEVNWPATRNSSTLHDSFPDTPDNVRFMSDDLRWEIVEKGILDDFTTHALWQHSRLGRDVVWKETAKHIIETRSPNLLLIHLLNVDGMHHRYGVSTDPGYKAMSLADYHVRGIFESLEKAGILDQTTLFIVSDHGFINTPKTFLPNVLLREAGLLTVERGEIVEARAQAVSLGGTAMIYLDDPDDYKLKDKVKSLFSNREEISNILTPDQFNGLGLAHPSESDQIGNLMLAAEPGFGIANRADLSDYLVDSAEHGFHLGNHGFLTDHQEMNALFVAYGRGIKPGNRLGLISNLSIAPTAAHLLGFEMEYSVGDVLDSILDLNFIRTSKGAINDQ